MLVLTVVLLLAASSASALNMRPIVGVLTQPAHGAITQWGNQYIPASYIKYVEEGGARAVPVFYNSTTEELRAQFEAVNGVLFPGGDNSLQDTQLYKAGEQLFKWAVEANTQGDYFPVFGHCEGFELLSIIVSGNFSVLEPMNAWNVSWPLHFLPAAEQSRWFGDMPADLRQILESEAVTLNNHHWGVTPAEFASQPALSKFLRPLTTNYDRVGVEFISTFEAIDFPIYGMQFHAEKPQFEWNAVEDINHSENAIRSMSYLARFLASEARKSNHSYPSVQAEMAALIYNYPAHYSEAIDASFEQVYLWQ